MGITFAYELGLKSFLYEKASTRKVTSKFQNPQKPNRKKVTGLLISGGKKIQKISNLLVAHLAYGAPLVTEKNCFRKKI